MDLDPQQPTIDHEITYKLVVTLTLYSRCGNIFNADNRNLQPMYLPGEGGEH